MLKWFKRLWRRGLARTRVHSAGSGAAAPRAVTKAEDVSPYEAALAGYVPLPNETPFEMLRAYRYLRDAIPDISDGVWTWKRLCQTGFDVEILGASSDLAKARAERLIDALNARVNSGDRGIDGLLDVFYGSLFTYGAAALEIVLTSSRESIHDVVPVDVCTVRFRREPAGLQAYQVHGGEEVRLPMERFIYVGMDRDGTNPYGRSMLRSIPLVVKVQQRLIEDMSKATRNSGWPRLHVTLTQNEGPQGQQGGNREASRDRELEALRAAVNGWQPDQNLVTYGNVKASVIEGNGRSTLFYENHKAIEEQVITGLHLMPILMGRNYGTTETYGTAQFEIINRHVESVNRSVQRILERLYNFELALMWGEARAKVAMRQNRTVDILREASARGKEIDNAIRMRDAGFWDQARAAKALGVSVE